MLTQDSQRTATDDFQQIDRDQLSDSGDPIRHFILISISNMIEPIDFFLSRSSEAYAFFNCVLFAKQRYKRIQRNRTGNY